MRKTAGIIIVLCICAASFTRCKEVKVECDYTVRTMAEVAKGQTFYETSTLAEVLVFFADASQWEVASYEDAVAGIITNEAGETRTADERGVPVEEGVFNFLFTREPVMLVAYHTMYPMFGWRDANVVENLRVMNIPVVFRSWQYFSENKNELITKPDTVRTSGSWTIVSIPLDYTP